MKILDVADAEAIYRIIQELGVEDNPELKWAEGVLKEALGVEDTKLTVRQLIQQEIDIDVYDNVCEELGVAFSGPVELTEKGREEFAEVLDYECELTDDACLVDVDEEEGKWQKKLKKAIRFFEAAAGYCSETDYNKWFKTEEE